MTTSLDSNGLDLDYIAPGRGQKYSPNLYAWLTTRRKNHRGWSSRVYKDAEGTLWIGVLTDTELVGSKLLSVLCNGSREESFAWQNINAVEVPDFWFNYAMNGRCAIDADHSMSFIGDDQRWKTSGDSRKCEWCGKCKQTMKRWTELVERSAWKNS